MLGALWVTKIDLVKQQQHPRPMSIKRSIVPGQEREQNHVAISNIYMQTHAHMMRYTHPDRYI